jgi:transposase InsO family protein
MPRQPAHHSPADDPHDALALFRYGLIAPIVYNPPAAGQLEVQLRAIAAQTYQIPGSTRTQVSVTSLRRYLKAYQAGGFEALRPQPRRDAGRPRAFAPEVLSRAIALREEQPRRTTQSLVEILQHDPAVQLDGPLCVHTLTTHLRREGKTRRLLAQAGRVYRHFERDHVNSLWQGDAMVGCWLPDPEQPAKKRRAHLFCFLDDHSRLVPHAEWFFEEALPRMERVLKIAILRRGLPRSLYLDNGQVFAATQFGIACATLGIQRIHGAPYSPEGRGKQERFFETLQTQFLPEVETSDITTLSELNESLWAWLECVYHQRPHAETGETPWARYTAGLDQVRSVDPETLRRAFLWREQRKVRRDATLALQGNAYQVDPHLAGRTVELRFDPFDLGHIEMFLDGRALGVARVVSQGRQQHLAVERLATEPVAPPKPKSSLDYLAALRSEYQDRQRREAGQLEFARLLPPDAPTPAQE